MSILVLCILEKYVLKSYLYVRFVFILLSWTDTTETWLSLRCTIHYAVQFKRPDIFLVFRCFDLVKILPILAKTANSGMTSYWIVQRKAFCSLVKVESYYTLFLSWNLHKQKYHMEHFCSHSFWPFVLSVMLWCHLFLVSPSKVLSHLTESSWFPQESYIRDKNVLEYSLPCL